MMRDEYFTAAEVQGGRRRGREGSLPSNLTSE